MSYKLSAILFGHKADVRGLAITHDNCIVSCSRDRTAKVWKPNGFNTGYTEIQTFHGHENFVTSICTVPPNDSFPNGLILTGGNDNVILVFEPSTATPIHKLSGHKDTVCKLVNGNESNTIVSASWDKSAKVWSLGPESKCLLTIPNHEAAVWAVLCLRKSLIVTGSADKVIRIFSSHGELVKSLKGHEDCVRDLAALSENVIVSCSNDSTIRQWSVDTGECINILFGHPNFVFSVSVLGELIASSGEDRCCMLWHQGNQETIALPAQSIWTVALLPNKDIVTGASDGVVRVFSADPSRQADEDILSTYANEVASVVQKADKHLGGIKVSDLPGIETLSDAGTKEGQTKLVRQGDEIICYSWSEAEKKWNQLGNVVGGSGGSTETSGKVLYEGKEYDYVFNVDIEDGKAPLKLPYDKTEDPWFAAQAFIHKNNLPQSYLEQVAYFIINNSKQENIEIRPPTLEFADPFTGGSRYVPGSSTSEGVRGTDPFTGSNRYVPMELASSDTHVKNEFFPQTTYLRFDQANLKQILDKLVAFNKEVGDEFKFSENDLLKVSQLGDINVSEVAPESIDLLKKLLNWPKEYIFPVLDILRLAARNSQVNNALCCDNYTFGYLKDNLQSDSPVANQMLSYRALCNMLSHKKGENLILSHIDYLTEVMSNCSHLSNKSLQIAVITLALNMSVAFYRNGDVESQSIVLLHLLSVLPQLTEQEAVFRGLVTMGTILTQARDLSNCIDKQLIERFIGFESAKVKQCSKYVLEIIS